MIPARCTETCCDDVVSSVESFSSPSEGSLAIKMLQAMLEDFLRRLPLSH